MQRSQRARRCRRAQATLGLLTAVWFGLSGQALAREVAVKTMAAPPSDIESGRLVLPDPAATGRYSTSAMIPIALAAAADGGFEWRAEVPIDFDGGMALAFLAPDAAQWEQHVRPPNAPWQQLGKDVRARGVMSRRGGLGPLAPGAEADRYDFVDAPRGTWSIRVRASARHARDDEPDGYLLVGGSSPLRMYSHLTTHALISGRSIGVAAMIHHDAPTPDGTPRRLTAQSIDTAVVTLHAADGSTLTRPMLDHGRSLDAAPGDGVVTAALPLLPPGNHVVRVELRGTTAGGMPFVRTTTHLVPIIEPAVTLTGQARARMQDDRTIGIDLDVMPSQLVNRVVVGAEVWATTPDGNEQPVCWIGGIVAPTADGKHRSLPLTLDRRWIARADAVPPITLRHVRVHDVSTFVPIAMLDAVVIPDAVFHDAPALERAAGAEITSDMLTGRPGARTILVSDAEAGAPHPPRVAGGHNLMLVHGYCSSGMPWPVGDFSGAVEVFFDPNQSRTNDAFALLIEQFGSAFKSFGVVGHSQGGNAALHLHTFYWSALDWSEGNRLIQSLGTPYQGTALAGDAAILGDIFGSGCGENFDLTYDGAALWLSTIPTWARSRVSYWTTSYADPPLSYDYCNFFTDLLLTDPDDGVIERDAGQLPGATNMGHTEGWCHTTGMRDPAQTTDTSRNTDLNANANR